MKIDEIVNRIGMPKFDFAWDNERVGFITTRDGEEIQFFPAKSKFDRSGAQDQAKRLALRMRNELIAADNRKREHEYQFERPLSKLEQEWAEMTNRFMSLSPQEVERWNQLMPAIRRSLQDGTHPAVKP